MLEDLMNILKNKYFSMVLLFLNVFVFIAGLYISNTDLMILAGLSFAAVLLSMEINNGEE